MYCVKCGVRLSEGTEKCPLCATPVWNPEGTSGPMTYPPTYPEAVKGRHKHAILFSITLLCVIACMIVYLVCVNALHDMTVLGIVDLGVLTGYILFVLPLWFRKPNPVIFLPIDHVVAACYVLYLCIRSGGSWFLSFAGPIFLASMILTEAFAALTRYVRGGRYYIFGGAFIFLGGITLLIEGLAHVTFGTGFPLWSPYAASVCGIIGLVLILAAIIRPMRDFFNRMFFI